MTAFQIVALVVFVTCCLVTLVRLVQASDRRWNDRFEASRQAGRSEARAVDEEAVA